MSEHILVVGYAAERTTAYTVDRIHRSGFPVTLLDIAAYLHEGSVDADPGAPGGYRVTVGGARWSFDDVTGVYCRPIGLREHRRLSSALQARLIQKLSVLEHVCSVLPRAINRPGRGRSNCSKPFQLLALRAHGFLVPNSYCTNMPDAPPLADGLARARLVYKSNSATRSIVAIAGPDQARQLHELENCPVLFQEHIAGPDVRVHMVGDRVFAQEIRSSTVDYRYPLFDDVDYRATEVPDDIRRLCQEFRVKEGLAFIAFDFKVAGDGRWYCLEANPMPGYDGFDERLDHRISSALIDALRES